MTLFWLGAGVGVLGYIIGLIVGYLAGSTPNCHRE